jgi:hypothetical protein
VRISPQRRAPVGITEGATPVLVDKKSVPWIVVAIAGLVVSTALYLPYAHASSKGATGGSWQGITYGIVGTAFMAFAMLLAVRKRLRTWQLGRVYTWTQGHVWLALLSYPIILFHAGFHWGQAWNLTWVMMWIFTIVIASGIFGLVIQNIIPTKLLNEVQLETIYDQIDHVTKQLSEEAENIVINASVPEEEAAAAGDVAVIVAAPAAILESAKRRLSDFYATQVAPYMKSAQGRGFALTNQQQSLAAFSDLRRSLPSSLRQTLDDLESIVNERRQLEHQRSLHHWLHFWLLIHVPLSYALTVLAIVHIVGALRFRQ